MLIQSKTTNQQMNISIRKIEEKDNETIKNIIRDSLTEYGGNRPGTAYYDEDILNMFDSYKNEKSSYIVVEVDGEVVGGGGFKHLNKAESNLCELQKVYIKKEFRGLGIGKMIVKKCIEEATKAGYEYMYLETFPNMQKAQILYRKLGFNNLDHSIGDTGHRTNEIWMLKKLK